MNTTKLQQTRINNALLTLTSYTDRDNRANLIDAITDLLHLAHLSGLDVHSITNSALNHLVLETLENA